MKFFKNLKKKVAVGMMTLSLAVASAVPVLASEGGTSLSSVESALTTSFRLLLGHYDYGVTRMYLHLAQQSQLLQSDIYQLDPVFFKKY